MALKKYLKHIKQKLIELEESIAPIIVKKCTTSVSITVISKRKIFDEDRILNNTVDKFNQNMHQMLKENTFFLSIRVTFTKK